MPGRIIVTSFASNIHRVQQVIDAAHELDRQIALVGRSMVKNVNIGRELGHVRVPEGMLVEPKDVEEVADERLAIVPPARRANARSPPADGVGRSSPRQAASRRHD